MIAYSQVVELAHSVRGMRVLSVYLPGGPPDPAERPAWRLALDDTLHALRHAHAGDSHTDKQSLDQAIAHVERALAAVGPVVRTPGWVAFATPGGIRLAEPLPVPTPLSVSWDLGARLAPLLEPLKEQRPAIVALVESRMARLFRYAEGAVTYLETVRAVTHVEPPEHMGAAPRQHFHTGTRGRTGTDQVQRERLAGRTRMMHGLADRMTELAGSDGWMLFGGAPTAARAAHAALSTHLASRARLMQNLHLRATMHEIAHAAAEGASRLRRDEDLATVRRVLEGLHATGHGVTDHGEVSAALAEHRLDQLLMSRSYMDQHEAEVERLTREAIQQGILVESVAGPGGEFLDQKASGIAGRLRYVPR